MSDSQQVDLRLVVPKMDLDSLGVGVKHDGQNQLNPLVPRILLSESGQPNADA